MQAIFQGIVLGLLLSILIGPVFFMLIQTSISKGFKAAMYLELGIFLSDAFCIFIAYAGVGALFANTEYNATFKIVGGIILIIFGIASFVAKPKQSNINELNEVKPLWLAIKGFVFNISNPSVIFFWLTSLSIAIAQFKNEKRQLIIYFSATLLTVFCIDVLKAYLAGKLRQKISDKLLQKVNKIAGLGIILFGIYLIFW